MRAEQLRAIGEAMYGPRWQSELARALGVTDRTIRRWAAGEWPVPSPVQAEIKTLLKSRSSTLREILQTL